ncbi:hypothetical protein I4U23_010802 [Adineta vaga]|nr:hypothetical protein I4U23_010802 [Adineta vaga]
MLAERFPDDEERGKIMGRTLSGVALGVAVGPIFGGVLYDHFGKTVPFLILAGVALVDGLLRLSIVSTESNLETQKLIKESAGRRSSAVFTLVRDPLISITIGACMITLFGVAIIQTILPIHMMVTMASATPLEQGLIFLPHSIALFISHNVFGVLGFRLGRWLCGMIGLCIAALYFALVRQYVYTAVAGLS